MCYIVVNICHFWAYIVYSNFLIQWVESVIFAFVGHVNLPLICGGFRVLLNGNSVTFA